MYNNDVMLMQQFNLNEPHQNIFDQNAAFFGLMTRPVFKTVDMTQVQPERIANWNKLEQCLMAGPVLKTLDMTYLIAPHTP